MSALPASTYPVHLTGHLDPQLARWRWLVKWLLAIPHVVVLLFLGIAMAFLTLAAGLNIAFTGRYPRRLFDFNVGVMRWMWRVQFYAGTLGTDRYPPFSLRPDPSYPADLEVAYPERLSRGLVWIKWWLLAIPHFLIVAFLAGGVYFPGVRLSGGLIAVLALVAGVHLAIGRAYPQSIFDLEMGLQRWCWRVAAYAALMTDEYPPFRLDPGEADGPGAGPLGAVGGGPLPA